jgi:hypothetical protein
LVKLGADTSRAMHDAQRGLAGDFEEESVWDQATQAEIPLDRAGYREIVKLLNTLGIV